MPVPDSTDHATNEHGDCARWCCACAEERRHREAALPQTIPDFRPTLGRLGDEVWVHQPSGSYLAVSTGPDGGVWLEIEHGQERSTINLTPHEASVVAAHISELASRG